MIRLTPLAGLWRPDAVYEITLNNQSRIAYEAPAGDEITDGDQVILTDENGNTTTFEYESGYTVVAPQTTLLSVTGVNTSFQDGNVFTIRAPSGNSLTFEINLVGSVAAGRVPVELSSATTTSQVRDAILAAFSQPTPGGSAQSVKQFLDLDPVAIGRSQIQLGTLAGHTPPLSINGLTVSGQPGGVTDGETFTYSTATETITFEFDSDNSLINNSNVAVTFTRQSTPVEIAQAIVVAVQSQPLGLAGAVASDQGAAVLGGVPGDVLDVSQSSLLQQGAPGVTSSLTFTVEPGETGASLNDETFRIDVDGTSLTFRYTTDANSNSTDRLILLGATDLTGTIATKTAAVIAQAFPGVLVASANGPTVTLGEPLTRPEPK